MTKPMKIATGIGVSGVACGALAAASAGVARFVWAWAAASCAITGAAYVLNRPAWLGKRHGRLSPWAVVIGPYVVAFRIACALMRAWRGVDVPTR
ncbi:MAG: hypothetical protein ACREQL_08765, partial [Candidatus Binatia bacterium]